MIHLKYISFFRLDIIMKQLFRYFHNNRTFGSTNLHIMLTNFIRVGHQNNE